MIDLVAAVLLLAVVAYAVFGGADFGAGFWDLVAGGDERGKEPREVIERAIGPVWEGNHVWLIFIMVVLWTAFSEAYASIWLTLFVPLSLAALGIVLRGSGFAFRKTVTPLRYRRLFGGAFAIPSVLVPFCLGAVVGAIASGRVPVGGVANDPIGTWLNPTSVLGGFLAVVAGAYLASVYLVVEAARSGSDEMALYFRRRALGSAIVVGVVAIGGVFVLRADAPYVFDGLTTRAAPFVIVSVVLGVASLVMLLRHRYAALTRATAALAVASIIVSWGVAQWDYILPETLTLEQAAAPSGTLGALVVAVVGVALFVGPGFIWLYRLHQQGMLPEESV